MLKVCNNFRITTDNIDILTDIGILYLKVNDTKGAFDKLFEVTRKYEYCPKAMLALGAILQVILVFLLVISNRLFIIC